MPEENLAYAEITDDLKAKIQARYREISAAFREAAATDGRTAQVQYEADYWAMATIFNVAPQDLNWITAAA